MKTTFDPSWKDWIKTNIAAGKDKNGIFKVLLDEGYAFEAIAREMKYVPNVPLSALKNPLKATRTAAERGQRVFKYGKPIPHDQLYIPNAVFCGNQTLELYRLDDFLNQTECSRLLELMPPQQGQDSPKNDAYNLSLIDDALVNEVESRIGQIIGIDKSYAGCLEGSSFPINQDTPRVADTASLSQPIYSFMVFLNDSEVEVEFAQAEISLKPVTGTAVIWKHGSDEKPEHPSLIDQTFPVLNSCVPVIHKTFYRRSAETQASVIYTKEANEYIPNYTKAGFYQSKLPEDLFNKITQFYNANRVKLKDEHIPGNFVFHKEKKGKVSSSLVKLSDSLAKEIHDKMKPAMESWCGKKLDPTFVYGIRVYHDRSVLASHRDRLETHIISAIINVDQEVNEDWPLIIEDNYGRRHSVILKPGDMVFYEGARLEHGRPIPFNGNSFANIFCHFKPTDYIPRKLSGS